MALLWRRADTAESGGAGGGGGDAVCLQCANHRGRRAKCKENVCTNSTCTEQPWAIFSASGKSKGTFGESPGGHTG